MPFYVLLGRPDTAEERITELEDRSTETTQTEIPEETEEGDDLNFCFPLQQWNGLRNHHSHITIKKQAEQTEKQQLFLYPPERELRSQGKPLARNVGGQANKKHQHLPWL